MIRDASDTTQDRIVLDGIPMDALDGDTIKRYRMRFKNLKEGHVWADMPDVDFLQRIGAAGRGGNDMIIHPTAAGLLMFGHEYEILNEFPQYFLDYREKFDENRWSDRVVSNSGDWSGNLYDFYFKVHERLTSEVKVPFVLEGWDRIDDTPMHKAVREALLNALIHSNYYERLGLVAEKRKGAITISNPGALRISIKEATFGGISDPRNAIVMKMFALVGIGERAGSGLANIERIWKEQGLPKPELTEQFNPDRTFLTLKFQSEEAGG